MKIEKLEQIDELLRAGGELAISGYSDVLRITEQPRKFHARIWKRGRPESSHNYIGDNAVDTLAGLENYLVQHAGRSRDAGA